MSPSKVASTLGTFSVDPIGKVDKMRQGDSHVIRFILKDLCDVSLRYDDSLTVTLQIGGYQVQRILVDTESSSNNLFHH